MCIRDRLEDELEDESVLLVITSVLDVTGVITSPGVSLLISDGVATPSAKTEEANVKARSNDSAIALNFFPVFFILTVPPII